MADVEIYSNASGQRLQVRTWLATIATATSIVLALKNLVTDVTTTLTATVITSFPAGTPEEPIVASEYPVEIVIPTGWAASHVGRWSAAVLATFPAAVIPGEPFQLEVKASPTT